MTVTSRAAIRAQVNDRDGGDLLTGSFFVESIAPKLRSGGPRPHRQQAGFAVLPADDSPSYSGRRRARSVAGYVHSMERLGSLARRYALEILSVVLAVESAVEVTLRRHAQHLSSPGWFAGPAVALVIVPLLSRRRFPFCAPAAVWLLAGAVSFWISDATFWI